MYVWWRGGEIMWLQKMGMSDRYSWWNSLFALLLSEDFFSPEIKSSVWNVSRLKNFHQIYFWELDGVPATVGLTTDEGGCKGEIIHSSISRGANSSRATDVTIVWGQRQVKPQTKWSPANNQQFHLVPDSHCTQEAGISLWGFVFRLGPFQLLLVC